MDISSSFGTASATSGGGGAGTTPQQSDYQTFLNMLTVQMRNQDPLKPVSDTEFIAQMAAFSNLEQTKAMSGDLVQLRQSNAFTQATALMGKNVRLLSGEDTFTKGIVTELEVMEGEVSVIVNGEAYELGQVVKVSSGETEDKNTKE